jgi:tRNA A-37 threonylcarbamoyl transferase component Bud32
MASDEPPGKLLGAGRAADVYALGDDRVLRRYRSGGTMQAELVDRVVRAEAEVMTYLAQAGFPVPKVYDAGGTDLVMQRLDGVDMLAAIQQRPWKAGYYGRLLAKLHDQLHEVTAPPSLRSSFAPGDRVMHLDLHPANVMLTKSGPVVIDWTNACAGTAGADAATAYLIMVTSEVDDLKPGLKVAAKFLRGTLVRKFRSAVSVDLGPHLALAARARMQDRNVRPAEAEQLRQIAEKAERSEQAEHS